MDAELTILPPMRSWAEFKILAPGCKVSLELHLVARGLTTETLC